MPAPLTKLALTRAIAAHALWVTSVGKQGAQLTLHHADLSMLDLRSAELSEASIPGANLAGADCTSARFFGANLASVDFSHARLTNALFNKAKLDYSILDSVHASQSSMYRAEFFEASAQGADFDGANLAQSYWQHATLRASSLRGARLHNAFIGDTDLRQVDWSAVSGVNSAVLESVRLSDTLTASDDEARAWICAAALGAPLVPMANYDFTAPELVALLAAANIVAFNSALADDLHVTPAQLAQAQAGLRKHKWLLTGDAGPRRELHNVLRTLGTPSRAAALRMRDKNDPTSRIITCGLGEALCTVHWVTGEPGATAVHHIQTFALRDLPLVTWHAVQQHGLVPLNSAPDAGDPHAESIAQTGVVTFIAAGAEPFSVSWLATTEQIFQVLAEPVSARPLSHVQLAQAVFTAGNARRS